MGTPSSKFQIIQEVLSQEGNLLAVSDLCRTAGVSRSGYYNWLHSADVREKKEAADLEDFQLILDAYQAHEQVWAVLPHSESQPVPKDGKGSANQPCRG